MRPTDPLPPRNERRTEELLEELCIALREVGLSTKFLPYTEPDPDIVEEVDRVRAIENELRARRVESMSRLELLSDETGWSMPDLLLEIRAYPGVRPWVRGRQNGLRIATTCEACGAREFPPDSRRIRICDRCLGVLESSLATAAIKDRMLLYRTYASDARCAHANDDTVLGVYPWIKEWSEDFPVGLCRECVAQELSRRRAG
jgi:hypothetical protein